uniref:Tail tape measure protein n=1 Tax=viral metagenome TaxID=1070528 RepID=A0A6M3KGU2_9ZZZZ
MAETLTELVARIKTDSTELEKGLTGAEKATEASSRRMQDSLKQVGIAMAAAGAAITAALGLMGKAAIDEEINIKRLATTVENSGTAYDSVRDSMEALIATTQRKTGVADDEQRNILNRLILITNDYGKALELLPTVLDLAAAGEMDATTAATYLGKAFLELEDGAEEVSVRFGQASLKFKSMEDIQNRVAGAAENLVNPLSVLRASIGDVAESIGATLIPIIKGAVDKIVDIAIKIQDWITENPELAKTLAIVAAALGVVLTVVGGLILILPTLISGITAFGVVFHVALGPIGLISLAIAGLIAAGIALWHNWDKVANFFKDMWEGIKNVFNTSVNWIIDRINTLIGWINKIPFVNIGTIGHIGETPELSEQITRGIGGFQHGGIVPGAIGEPQLAVVHGGETIIPPNESMGSVVVNFTQPVFFDREDTMNRFVDMIRKGIQRQDRLRFGGAYSG